MKLIHEVWCEQDENGEAHTCCLAGPRGDSARALLGEGAHLLETFEAGSHFEAMTIFNTYLDRCARSTDPDWDREPYPEAWLTEQSEME